MFKAIFTGIGEGAEDGAMLVVGEADGLEDGALDGCFDGTCEGVALGLEDGDLDGLNEGCEEGVALGLEEGFELSVGTAEGVRVAVDVTSTDAEGKLIKLLSSLVFSSMTKNWVFPRPRLSTSCSIEDMSKTALFGDTSEGVMLAHFSDDAIKARVSPAVFQKLSSSLLDISSQERRNDALVVGSEKISPVMFSTTTWTAPCKSSIASRLPMSNSKNSALKARSFSL